MEVLAIIPARGGSKSVSHKNLRLVGGKPLITHAVESARAAMCIRRVVVSTDDEKIAQAARVAGADVIMRPAEISGDDASSESAVMHALEQLETAEGYRPECIVFMQCTSPLITSEDIDQGFSSFIRTGADALFSAVPYHGFLWEEVRPGEVKAINHDASIRQMRQACEHQYQETGAFYIMTTKGFFDAKHRFFGKVACHPIDASRAIDIDTEQDLKLADYLMRERQKESKRVNQGNRLEKIGAGIPAASSMKARFSKSSN
tara:strand:- start:1298 stop:2080 length:783 start_codon:yes stop_codon:yes gene_type:complete